MTEEKSCFKVSYQIPSQCPNALWQVFGSCKALLANCFFSRKEDENQQHITSQNPDDFNIWLSINIFFITVFSGVKAAVFSGEKKSKSRGAAYTQQQQNSAVKTSRPFARMGL